MNNNMFGNIIQNYKQLKQKKRTFFILILISIQMILEDEQFHQVSQFNFFQNQQGRNSLYQLDVQISFYSQQMNNHQIVQNQSQYKYLQDQSSTPKKQFQILVKQKRQYYLHLIKQKSNHQFDSEEIEKTVIKKTKQIRKYKENAIDLSAKIKTKPSKKHINQLWGNRVVAFLKLYSKQYDIPVEQVLLIKKSIVHNLTIRQLALILKQHTCLRKIIEKKQIEFMDLIYNSSCLSDQSKLILFETYDIFIEAITHPENLKTWDHELNTNMKESQQIYQKIKDKNLDEIIKFALVYFQYQKMKNNSKKCASNNNTTYYWAKYLKDVASEQQFINTFSTHQQYQNLLNSICLKNPSIENVRKSLSIQWFANYIIKTKIDGFEIIRQIIMNSKINLLGKMNMLISLPAMIMGLKDPLRLSRWNL